MSCDQDCASSRMRLTLIPADGTLSLSSGCARLDFDFAPVLRGDPGPPGAGSGGSGAVIDDAASTGNTSATWSANKLVSELEAAKAAVKDDLTAGTSAALDTLAELAAALNYDANFAATLAAEIANRVRYDAPQTLTTTQQAQACANIGVGDPTTDFVADYSAAKA